MTQEKTPKIVVCFTSKELSDYTKDSRRLVVPVQEWVACCMREKIREAGIPLRLTLSPLSDFQVTSGRLYWSENLKTQITTFEWYEN